MSTVFLEQGNKFLTKQYAFVSWGDIRKTKDTSKYNLVKVKKDSTGNASYIELN